MEKSSDYGLSSAFEDTNLLVICFQLKLDAKPLQEKVFLSSSPTNAQKYIESWTPSSAQKQGAQQHDGLHQKKSINKSNKDINQ
jgi:hypothetical protein